MKIQFYTPEHGVSENVFGCATLGFAGQGDTGVSVPMDIRGDLVCGSYDDCLAGIPNKPYQAAIVLLGNAGGENAFIRKLSLKVQIPLVGGGAAIHPTTGETAMVTGRKQAAVFLIDDDRYRFEVCCENIHRAVLSEHRIGFTDPRQMDTIDGVDAATWLKEKRKDLELSEDDFEHLTFSDGNGINAHLSCVEGKICSGRDLEEKMLLRYVPGNRVYERMRAFYDDQDAVVFGCAGLKGILPKPLQAEAVGLYLFGEVCTKDGVSEFGNLMLSKLRILPK